MAKGVLISEYSGATLNTVYKDAENVVPMENENLEEGKTWRVTRKYAGMFSCEDAVKMILEIHADTEEEE